MTVPARSFAFLGFLAATASSVSAQAPPPLPLGHVVVVQRPVTCPSGFFTGMTCEKVEVAGCAGVADLSNVTLGFKNPAGIPKGTIVLHGGGGGQQPFNAGPSGSSYVDQYLAGGYQVVQMAWPSDWEDTGEATKSIKLAACRPATILAYIADPANQIHTTGAFCAQGHSGGTGAWGYTLAWYDGGSMIDKVLLTSGPVFGDIALGCVVPDAPDVTVVPTNGSAWSTHPSYVGSSATNVALWTGDGSCQGPSPTSCASYTAWKDQSIVSGDSTYSGCTTTGPSASFSYPQTALSGWLCNNNANNSAGEGYFFYRKFTSPTQTAHFSLTAISQCPGAEDIWDGMTPQGTSGLTASANDMLDPVRGCIPRHATGCVGQPDGAACDDGDPCTTGDACSGGDCTGTAIAPPQETQGLVSSSKTSFSWNPAASATRYDVVRGAVALLPVGPGGGDEACFDNLAGTTLTDPAVPVAGAGFWYLARGKNSCGAGTYGAASDGSPRSTTTCP
jgi:hypothetical protein